MLRRLRPFFLLLFSSPCFAVDTAASLADAGPQTLTALFENDLFGDSDQQYTNGFKLNWMSPNLKALGDAPAVPGWLLSAVHGLKAFEHAVRQAAVGYTGVRVCGSGDRAGAGGVRWMARRPEH